MNGRKVEMVLLDGAQDPDRVSVSLAGGTVVAYTCRAPDKESDNEDTVAAISCGDGAAVLVVADGAGGLPGGKRASLTAVTVLERCLNTALAEEILLRTAVLNGIEEANRAVMELGSGSATTLTLVTLEGRDTRTYQIGDSEALVVGQRGRIKAQTTAHSPTGFAVEAGFLDQRAALHHEERHLVSNFIGAPDMHVDMGGMVRLKSRDTIMLASDGLTDNLHMHEIIELVRKGPLDDAADALIRLAGRRMASASETLPSKPDDLSLILFRSPITRGTANAGKKPA